MVTSLITGNPNIWDNITKEAKNCKLKSFVAVAYFSKNASEMLPLKKDSILVVDASEGVVKSGQTCPSELLKLYNKGIKIFSYAGLHAKIYILGNKAFIGSANVSAHSANYLKEAVLQTTDHKVIKDSISFIKTLCSKELGPDSLSELQKVYKSPKFITNFKGKSAKLKTESNNQKVYVVKLVTMKRNYDTSSEDYKQGRLKAERLISNSKRHEIQDYKHGLSMKPKIGDTVIRVTNDEGFITIAPPATIVNIQKIAKTKKCFVYVECLDVKDKKLSSVEKRLKTKDFERGGLKSPKLAAMLNSLWL